MHRDRLVQSEEGYLCRPLVSFIYKVDESDLITYVYVYVYVYVLVAIGRGNCPGYVNIGHPRIIMHRILAI